MSGELRPQWEQHLAHLSSAQLLCLRGLPGAGPLPASHPAACLRLRCRRILWGPRLLPCAPLLEPTCTSPSNHSLQESSRVRPGVTGPGSEACGLPAALC